MAKFKQLKNTGNTTIPAIMLNFYLSMDKFIEQARILDFYNRNIFVMYMLQ